MCESFGFRTNVYYAYFQKTSKLSKNAEFDKTVLGIFGRHKRRYGTRRIVEELKDDGLHVGRTKVRSTLKKYGLKAIQPKSFVPKTTRSNPGMIRSPNLLLDREAPRKPNEVWVGDITYLPLQDGSWAYLSTWLDLYSHMIVGWLVGETLEEELVVDSFTKGLKNRSPVDKLIVHSDGGGQYGSKSFRKIILANNFKQSMTRRDNHYDNATAESFYSRLKAEELQGGKYRDIEDARSRCFEYIEGYYNTIRKHSSIGYKSPLKFEREYEEEI